MIHIKKRLVHDMPIKKVDVMSRASAIWLFGRQFTEQRNPPKTAMISISSLDQQTPDFNMDGSNGLIKTCLMSFDDEEQGTPGCIEQKDAEKIADFVRSIENNNEIERLVVHCGAGVSRSAGVAAACSLYLLGDDSEFFSSRYCPNRTCYRMVLDALLVPLTDEQIDERFGRNKKEYWTKRREELGID